MNTDYCEVENLRKWHTEELLSRRLHEIEEARQDGTEEQLDWIEQFIANIETVLIERGFPVEFLDSPLP